MYYHAMMRAYIAPSFATSEDVPMSARHPRGRTFLAAVREASLSPLCWLQKPYKTIIYLGVGNAHHTHHTHTIHIYI